MDIVHKFSYRPALLESLRHYSLSRFKSDLTAGTVVGIVALPLAIAFAIASGVSPTAGLITAIIGGFMVSAFGGNTVQIGGPTGAFIVIIYNIISLYGLTGLAIATCMAGVLLLIMGVFKLGTVIKFIPYPIVVGFTAGIALTIFSTQMPDFFGLTLQGETPGDFIGKWVLYFRSASTVDPATLITGAVSLLIIIGTPYISKRLPGPLLAIIVVSLGVWALDKAGLCSGVETIGSRFGTLPTDIPTPQSLGINMESIRLLLPSAFTIAMLGAIARTMTNITNGGRSPIAGIIHALVLLLVFLFLMPLINLVPMSCLAAVLIVVAYNMSGWRTVRGIFRNPAADISVLVVTFLLTVIFDLTIAIEMGMLLAVVLFLKRVMQNTTVRVYGEQLDAAEGTDLSVHEELHVVKGVSIYEIDGPFFFGVATKFDEVMRGAMREKPVVRIIRMRKVPFIDATGVHNLEILINSSLDEGIAIVLSGVQPNVREVLNKAGVERLVGSDRICSHISRAVVVANEIAGSGH